MRSPWGSGAAPHVVHTDKCIRYIARLISVFATHTACCRWRSTRCVEQYGEPDQHYAAAMVSCAAACASLVQSSNSFFLYKSHASSVPSGFPTHSYFFVPYQPAEHQTTPLLADVASQRARLPFAPSGLDAPGALDEENPGFSV